MDKTDGVDSELPSRKFTKLKIKTVLQVSHLIWRPMVARLLDAASNICCWLVEFDLNHRHSLYKFCRQI